MQTWWHLYHETGSDIEFPLVSAPRFVSLVCWTPMDWRWAQWPRLVGLVSFFSWIIHTLFDLIYMVFNYLGPLRGLCWVSCSVRDSLFSLDQPRNSILPRGRVLTDRSDSEESLCDWAESQNCGCKLFLVGFVLLIPSSSYWLPWYGCWLSSAGSREMTRAEIVTRVISWCPNNCTFLGTELTFFSARLALNIFAGLIITTGMYHS